MTATMAHTAQRCHTAIAVSLFAAGYICAWHKANPQKACLRKSAELQRAPQAAGQPHPLARARPNHMPIRSIRCQPTNRRITPLMH